MFFSFAFTSVQLKNIFILDQSGDTEGWGRQVWRVAACLCDPQKGKTRGSEFYSTPNALLNQNCNSGYGSSEDLPVRCFSNRLRHHSHSCTLRCQYRVSHSKLALLPSSPLSQGCWSDCKMWWVEHTKREGEVAIPGIQAVCIWLNNEFIIRNFKLLWSKATLTLKWAPTRTTLPSSSWKEPVSKQCHTSLQFACHKWDITSLCSSSNGVRSVFPLQPCSTYNEENCVANGWGKDKFGSDGRYSLPGSKSFTIPNPDQVRLHLERGCLPCCEPEWVPGERFFWNRCYIKSPIRHLCNLILNTFLLEKKQLRTTRLGRFFELDKSFICAGGVKASQK